MTCHSDGYSSGRADGQQDMFAAPIMREHPGRKSLHHISRGFPDGTVNSICQSCGNDCKQVYPARVVSCRRWESRNG